MASTASTTRKIVRIDEDKCNGCGQCVPSCAEGAIRIIDGKARLIADNLCDGLGNCLGTCPQDAIHIEERPADAFDAEAGARQQPEAPASRPTGACPGSLLRRLSGAAPAEARSDTAPAGDTDAPQSRLGHWPVQLALLPLAGPIWADTDVLLAADCVAAAMPDFHPRLVAGRTLAIACPKLDDSGAHEAKLAAVFAQNPIRSVTVARMEVPCCGGLTALVRAALRTAGRSDLTLHEITIGVDGRVMGEPEIELGG
jgi:NAD-dependent dihydropyrimidine dehydrogenase PreA subunit